MPQLHFSVDESTANELEIRARQAGMTLSRYLAELVLRQVGPSWPDGYLERVIGGCAGDPLEEPSDLELRDVEL